MSPVVRSRKILSTTISSMTWCNILSLSLFFPGLMSWDVSSCHVDLAKELDIITECSPPGEEARGGNCCPFDHFLFQVVVDDGNNCKMLAAGPYCCLSSNILTALMACYYVLHCCRWTIDSVCNWALGDGGPHRAATEHVAAMYEKHAWKLHQAPTHPARRIHLCRNGSMGSAGMF